MRESDYLHVNKETVGTFLRVPILKHFGANLQKVLQVSRIRRYDRGEYVIKEGDRDPWIFCLISGEAQVTKQDQPISILAPGDIFGEMSIIDGSSRSASVCALKDTVCLATDVSRVGRSENNEMFLFIFYRIFAQILAHRLRTTNEKLIAARQEIARLTGEDVGEITEEMPDFTDLEDLFPTLKE